MRMRLPTKWSTSADLTDVGKLLVAAQSRPVKALNANIVDKEANNEAAVKG